MNIFFIDANNDTPQVNYPLADGLLSKGMDFTYYTSFNRWSAKYYQQNYPCKTHYIFFKWSNKIKLQRFRQVAKGLSYPVNMFILFIQILIKKPSIVHFNNVNIELIDFIFYRLLKLLKLKIVLTQHNFIEHEKKTNSKIKLKIFRQVDQIICLSEYTKMQFPEHIQSMIKVIPHGNTYEKEINTFANLPLPDIKPKVSYTILFFGLIRPYKGIENLIEACTLLPEGIKSRVTVTIAGNSLSKSYMQSLKSLSSINKNITFIDRFIEYDEIIAAIQQSDIGILPYNSATQSGVPYLYTSLLKPLIVTNVGALPEQLNQEVAVYCEPNAKAIAKAMEIMVTKLDCNDFKSSNFLNINEINKWNNIIELYINMYRNI